MYLPEPIFFPLNIRYLGKGQLLLEKSARGYLSDPMLEKLAVHPDRNTRAEAEYVPGFKGLSFDLKKLMGFKNGDASQASFIYPDWTCSDYEKWLKESPTKSASS